MEPKNWCGSSQPVDIYLYVLELEDGCFYVGLTGDIERRFAQHVDGQGANWTSLHKPRRVFRSIYTGTRDEREALALENAVTIELMQQHGTARVRGGCYSSISQENIDGLLRSHGHWQTIKQNELNQQRFTLESSWSDALEGFLEQALDYYDAGCPETKVDELFLQCYKLSQYRYWHDDFSPGLSWHFWGKRGILPVLLSFKHGRTIGSRLAMPFDVLAAALNRGKRAEFPLRRLFLLAWQAYQPTVTTTQANTLKRFMGYLENDSIYDRQYDAFVSVLLPETRHLLRSS